MMLLKLIFVAFATTKRPSTCARSSTPSQTSTPPPPSPFPTNVSLPNYGKEHETLLATVNEVNHGEFEKCVETLLECSRKSDKGGIISAPIVGIHRCRRGGKSFMASAVAAALTRRVPSGTYVIKISLSDSSVYASGEDAVEAILSRIAFALTGLSGDEYTLWKYDDFQSVLDFLDFNEVILLVDELTNVPLDAPRCGEMAGIVSRLVGKKGNALMYSTHTDSPLEYSAELSMRPHICLPLPQLRSQQCVDGLVKNRQIAHSFWFAMMRGRSPALFILDAADFEVSYLSPMSEVDANIRRLVFRAAITGNVDSLPNDTRSIRALSFSSHRESPSGQELHCWPPFVLAAEKILGKSCTILRRNLQEPTEIEAKAYESLFQLGVLIRLLSNQPHPLVPISRKVNGENAHNATEIYYVSENAKTVDEVIAEVKSTFRDRPHVLQVLAVPLNPSFKGYDFLVLHLHWEDRIIWVVEAGYQIKKSTQTTKFADQTVPLSVWLQGDATTRKLRPGDKPLSWDDGSKAVLRKGFILLDRENQEKLLGASIAEALPKPKVKDGPTRCCSAAKSLDGNNK